VKFHKMVECNQDLEAGEETISRSHASWMEKLPLDPARSVIAPSQQKTRWSITTRIEGNGHEGCPAGC